MLFEHGGDRPLCCAHWDVLPEIVATAPAPGETEFLSTRP
jgi:hypothetical protein